MGCGIGMKRSGTLFVMVTDGVWVDEGVSLPSVGVIVGGVVAGAGVLGGFSPVAV